MLTWLFIGPIILSGFAMGLACPGRSSCRNSPPSLAVKYPFRRENASLQMKRPLPLSRFARVRVCLENRRARLLSELAPRRCAVSVTHFYAHGYSLDLILLQSCAEAVCFSLATTLGT